ncbi:MAG: ImmA/IrrE family metallo-endopeptidase [Firmicutes bacterium]|nr:ImmA/IrrE family metallo-endopeptidase [Bacillota bacterium]
MILLIKTDHALAETRAIKTRNEFGLSNTEAINIFEVLKYNGDISIIRMPIESDLYGLFIKKEDAQAILINTNNSLGRQYFTAAHEYYHLKYDVNLNSQNQELEKEADTFASYLLMSREGLNFHLKKRLTNKGKDNIDIADCLYLENYFKISHQALVLRLKLDKHIRKRKYEELLDYNIRKEAVKYGYSLELYSPTILDKDMHIYSDYAELAEIALNNNQISEGKYNEYLLEGGYEDILFGDEQDV